MAAANPLIVKLLAQTDDHKIAATIDEVLKKLEEDGLAYRLSIPPKLVGVHPCNRDGYGISATEVHSLGSDIVGMGWSWKACAQAVCIEDDPQSTIATHTADMVSASNGGLGRADQLQVKFGSLACGHTNRFLCAVLDAVPCELENLSVDGRMSFSKIVGKDPGLQDALKSGLNWLVLKATVGVLYPTLPDLVQRAMQATGLAQRDEIEVQLLQRIQGAAKTMLARDKTVDWPTIASTVGKGRPESVDVEALIRYVQKWGGLPHGAFIADLNAFHKVYVPSGRPFLDLRRACRPSPRTRRAVPLVRLRGAQGTSDLPAKGGRKSGLSLHQGGRHHVSSVGQQEEDCRRGREGPGHGPGAREAGDYRGRRQHQAAGQAGHDDGEIRVGQADDRRVQEHVGCRTRVLHAAQGRVDCRAAEPMAADCGPEAAAWSPSCRSAANGERPRVRRGGEA